MAEERHSRQTLFYGIGPEGQKKLAQSRVLLVGCGGLGTVCAEILARAGTGSLTIADRDYVDESNLQRQSLFTESDCREGLPKAIAAVRRLREIDANVRLSAEVLDVRSDTIGGLIQGHDLVMDGTDNFETRYLLNDASLKWGLPWVYGACVGAYGVCIPFIPGATPCLRCVLEHLPAPGSSPTCDTVGVIGPIVHAVAALQTAEALKLLTGNANKVSRRLVSMDLWENRIAATDLAGLERNPGCPACGEGRYEFLEGRHEQWGQTLCGRNAVQITRSSPQSADLEGIASRLRSFGPVACNEHLLRARVEQYEIAVFRDGRSIIRGTRSADEARRVYARYVGS